MPTASGKICCETSVVATKTLAEKAAELKQAGGLSAYSVDGESMTFRSLKEMTDFQDWCDRRNLANDPTCATVDVEISHEPRRYCPDNYGSFE